MRKLIIAGILLVFVVYCHLAYMNQTYFTVPGYVIHEVDITGGLDPASEEWKKRKSDAFSILANRRLEPAGTLPTLEADPSRAGKPLSKPDLDALLKAGVRKVTVKDPEHIFKLVERRLHLRQDVKDPLDAKKTVGAAGDPVTKLLIDKLLAAKVERVALVGGGDVVGFNATLLMVILIFCGLVLVLKEILWEPLAAFCDKRNAEIAEGLACVRGNKDQAARMAKEEHELMREAYLEYQRILRQKRHETMQEAEKVVAEAWAEMGTLRDARSLEFKDTIAQAEKSLDAQLPELAGQIYAKVGGGKS